MMLAARTEREETQAIKSTKSADDKPGYTQGQAQNAGSNAAAAPVGVVATGSSLSKVAPITPRGLSHGLKEKAKEVYVALRICVSQMPFLWSSAFGPSRCTMQLTYANAMRANTGSVRSWCTA